MRGNITAGKCLAVILVLIATIASAQQPIEEISGYLPKSDDIAGWNLSDAPKNYRGDELFLMIDGGADIYQEYGFEQVLAAQYVNDQSKSIAVEIYEMKSPAAAYGIFSFKTGDEGKALAIGQEALLEEYYLNFWKGNMLVTVIGSDADQQTVQGVVDFAKAVDARLTRTGQRPALAEMLLREPLAFSHPKYVRGAIGAMNNYIFDTDNIFRVREGMIGFVDHCRTLVFSYRNENESAEIYEKATAKLSHNSRFRDGARHGNHYATVDHRQAFVLIQRTGPYIAIVIGQDKDKVKTISKRLTEKLKNG